mmetsp:Transcript_39645/g.71394  ORF Transcript_39645/g.71394 Transcript_39645/m.71394 type:complete len:228 (+) Transcript_39645:681-1364(+)
MSFWSFFETSTVLASSVLVWHIILLFLLLLPFLLLPLLLILLLLLDLPFWTRRHRSLEKIIHFLHPRLKHALTILRLGLPWQRSSTQFILGRCILLVNAETIRRYRGLIISKPEHGRFRTIRQRKPRDEEFNLPFLQRADEAACADYGRQRPFQRFLIVALLLIVIAIPQCRAECRKTTLPCILAPALSGTVDNLKLLLRHILLPLSCFNERFPIIAVIDPPFRPAP